MANEAPERIWIWPDTIDEMGSSVNRNEINGYVEYVRADKLEELAADNERLEKNLRTVQNAAKTLASAQGTELEHRRRNADYDHKLRTEHESLIERDAVMTDALLNAEAELTSERAAHAETKRERDEALKALEEAREVVDACAGDSRPARAWAVTVRDGIDAVFAARRVREGEK